MVDPLWRRKVRTLQVLCRVSYAVALGPLFVTFDAWKRASEDEATRTAVFLGVNMASESGYQLGLSCGKCKKNTNQIEHKELSRGSGMMAPRYSNL